MWVNEDVPNAFVKMGELSLKVLTPSKQGDAKDLPVIRCSTHQAGRACAPKVWGFGRFRSDQEEQGSGEYGAAGGRRCLKRFRLENKISDLDPEMLF